MTSETEILTVRIPTGTKGKLAAAARARNTKPAALVNALLLALLDEDADGGAVVPSAGQLQLRRAEFAIPEFLRDALRKRAVAEGFKPARWVSLLVQANLMGGGVLTDVELLAVKEASRELAASQRSLTKAVATLRDSREDAQRGDAAGRALLEQLPQMDSAIEKLRCSIDQLVVQRSRAWGQDGTRA